jgi:hypothetical protein
MKILNTIKSLLTHHLEKEGYLNPLNKDQKPIFLKQQLI